MKRSLTFFFLSSFLIGCGPSSSAPEPAIVTHAYMASNTSILNPERGFFTPYELPGSAGFSPVRATGNTLVHLNIRLDDWRETDIPQDVLDGLDSNFADIREAGIKAIIRFAYNEGPYPDSEPDASKAQVLRHIEQLTPLLQNNADVIAWMEAGFIGAWGEWHTSTNELDNLTDKRDILDALRAAIPDRYVQVRYPANIIEMFADPADAAQAHVAHHNDCFLSSETDVGTYERGGVITIERDKAYLAELTRLTPMSGETCAPNPPRSECASAIQEMELLHFSAINEAYHKGILRSWEEGGCMEEITNRLGYRFTLIKADFNEQIHPGGVLRLRLLIENLGFASLVNQRTVYAVLDGEERYVEPLYHTDSIYTNYSGPVLDPRMWESGYIYEYKISFRIPSSAPEGKYKLALWVPDPSETLMNDPRYAIQFANQNIWDETNGFNILSDQVEITSSASGDYELFNKEFRWFRSDSNWLMKPGYYAMRSLTSTAISSLTEESTSSALAAATAPFESPSISMLISHPQISSDAENVYFSFDYVSGAYNAFQLFVDNDQNPNTGFVIDGIGAETLFENHTWNIYDGSGPDWKWQPTEVLIHFEDTGSHVSWTIARSLLNSSQFDVVFQLVDTNWDSVSTTRKQTHTLK